MALVVLCFEARTEVGRIVPANGGRCGASTAVRSALAVRGAANGSRLLELQRPSPGIVSNMHRHHAKRLGVGLHGDDMLGGHALGLLLDGLRRRSRCDI